MNKNPFHDAIGTVIFGLILEEAGEDENSFKAELLKVVDKTKKLLGDKEALKFLNEGKQGIATIICASFDWALLTKLTQPTVEAMKNLPPEQKILAELFYLNFTGRSVIKSGDSDHWPNFLWSAKKATEKYVKLSPSGITAERVLEFLKPIVIEFYNLMWKELGLQD